MYGTIIAGVVGGGKSPLGLSSRPYVGGPLFPDRVPALPLMEVLDLPLMQSLLFSSRVTAFLLGDPCPSPHEVPVLFLPTPESFLSHSQKPSELLITPGKIRASEAFLWSQP